MPVLQASDITDLANQTLADLGRFRMVDISSDIREHVAMSNLLKKNRIRISSGETIKWNLLEDGDENAKNVGLYNRDNTNVKDGTFIMNIPWRHTQTSCAFDVREARMNAAPAKIVDYVATKRQQSMISLVKMMEANWWQGPTAGSSDEDTPFGIFAYWADGSTIDTTGAFNGSNGNYGSIGGQSCVTHPRLKHYNWQYTNVTETDAVDHIRDSLVLTRFMPVVDNAPVPEYSNGEQRVIYSTWTVCKALEKIARNNNDQMQGDLDRYHGKTSIQGIAIREVPYFTENKDTSHPILGIDWKQVHTCVLAGSWMVDSPFEKKDGQHNVREMFTDCSYQFRIWNRRKGLWLGAKSDPLSS